MDVNYWAQVEAVNYGIFDAELTSRMMNQWQSDKVDLSFMDNNILTGTLGKRKTEAKKTLVRNSLSPAIQAMGMHQIDNSKDINELMSVCDSYNIVFKLEGKMATKNEEIAALKAEIARLTKKVELVEHGRMGKEPQNGSVFKIVKRFEKLGSSYTYAAIKAGGLWYLTGTSAAGTKIYTWEDLKKFIGTHSRVWVMTAREELVEE